MIVSTHSTHDLWILIGSSPRHECELSGRNRRGCLAAFPWLSLSGCYGPLGAEGSLQCRPCPCRCMDVLVFSYRSRAKIRTNTFGAPRILWIIGKLAGEIWGFPEIREGNRANLARTHDPRHRLFDRMGAMGECGKLMRGTCLRRWPALVARIGPCRTGNRCRHVPRCSTAGRKSPSYGDWEDGQAAGSCDSRRADEAPGGERHPQARRSCGGPRSMAAETSSCRLLARRLVAQNIITRWQAGQLLVGWTKLRLGKYVLRSQIGRGEFWPGVSRPSMRSSSARVAIKTLSRRFTQ